MLIEYQGCRLCPRHCGVDRVKGETGVCGESATCRVSSFCVHHGEEPPISGKLGSGTVFFAGCSCQCFFCQNYQISHEHLGRQISSDELFFAVRALLAKGVHNLNFVTPDHFWPHIRQLSRQLRKDNVNVPLIYNCSGYVDPSLVPEIARAVDIFMPDIKFVMPDLSRVCMNAPDYPDIAFDALDQMVQEKGFLEPFDLTGASTAERGVLVRHLVLPGHVENSLAVLRRLRVQFGKMLPLSVMSQYRPMPECRRRGLLARRVSALEYRTVCDLIEELEFQQVFIQPIFDDDDEFVPDFESDEPFSGNTVAHP